jgi:predicted ATPase
VEHTTAQPPQTITRFRSRNIAALLAYLALHGATGHARSRDELADLLWPDADLDSARNNLRVALSSLRKQLEPPGVPAGAVLLTEGRARVGLNPLTTRVDVADFEETVRRSERADVPPAEQIALLEKAARLYQGPLLPGFYEDWVSPHRARFAQSHQRLLALLAAVVPEAGTGLVGQTEPPSGQLSRAAAPPTPPAKDREPTVTDGAPALVPGTKAPLFLSRFFGREKEAESLSALLQPRPRDVGSGHDGEVSSPRLVTISGPGGSGKTRLALHVIQCLALPLRGRVFWVALTEVANAGCLAQAVADAVAPGMGTNPGENAGDPLARAAAALSGDSSPSLLVLDNFEHLAEDGAAVLEELLTRTPPSITYLVTSRQLLLLGVEREFPLSPLPTPALSGSTAAQPAMLTPEHLMTFAGVQLFVDRAQVARPDFQLTTRNAAAVGALCDRLDGLPLALELAAGWALILTPEQMLARLDQEAESLLVARRRDTLPRHRSLRTVLLSSYQLLEPDIQRLFARSSVFRGSWTAAATQAVCGDSDDCESRNETVRQNPQPSQDIVNGLIRLRERSLLVSEEYEGEIRFRMLLTVRAFADEQLTYDERTATRQKHALHYVRLAEEAQPHLRGGCAQTQWITTLEADLDNIRAVLSRTEPMQPYHQELALRLAGALWWFWVIHSHWSEGLQWLRKVLADEQASGGSAPSAARAKALYAAAGLASALNLLEECRAYCERGLEACRLAGDHWGAAFTTALLGAIAARQGDYEQGCALMEKGLAEFRGLNSSGSWGTAFALDNLAHACRDRQDYERAAALYEESLSLRKELEDRQGVAMSLSNLADTAQLRGDWAKAAVLHEASLERFRQLGDQAGIGYGLRRLGECALWQGDEARADALNRESIILFRELGDKRRLAECLEKTAILRQKQGQAEAAARLFGAANALREAIGMPLPASEKRCVEDSIAVLKETVGQEAFWRAWLQGRIMGVEDAVDCAL